MDTTPASAPTLANLSLLWQRIWARYRQQWPLFFRLALITNILTILSALFTPVPGGGWSSGLMSFGFVSAIVFIGGLIAAVWGSLAMYFAVANPDQAPTVNAAFKLGGPFFLDSFTTGLLAGLWVLLGLILLVIPGFYWAILYSLATYLVFKERLANMAALKRSKQLITGHWWAVFWRVVLFGVGLGLLSSILPWFVRVTFIGTPLGFRLIVGNVLNAAAVVLVFPIQLLLMAEIYNDLVKLKPSAAVPPTKQ